ncbi:hypothetical protein, partial [uncultured Muribaculum sp.]
MFLMMLCALATFSLPAQTQTVSINVKDVTIKELLKQIEAQSKYTFAYADSQIPVDRRVSVTAVDKPIEEILCEAIPGITVKTEGRKILITPVKKEKSPKGNYYCPLNFRGRLKNRTDS